MLSFPQMKLEAAEKRTLKASPWLLNPAGATEQDMALPRAGLEATRLHPVLLLNRAPPPPLTDPNRLPSCMAAAKGLGHCRKHVKK